MDIAAAFPDDHCPEHSQDRDSAHTVRVGTSPVCQQAIGWGRPGQRGACGAMTRRVGPVTLRGVLEPNHLLRAAREATSSRQVPGVHMSRRELAEAVTAWLWDTTQKRYALDAHYIAKMVRHEVA